MNDNEPWGRFPAARSLGKLDRRNVLLVPVEARVGSTVLRTHVIARSAADAANWVRDRALERMVEVRDWVDTQITAYGPKGGEAHRYIGCETWVAHSVMRPRSGQLELF